MFEREIPIIGEEGFEKLQNSHVAVFGVGGVGGFICETLARAGIGEISLFDFDTVAESNINRQIIATTKTIGRLKVDVLEERLQDINPKLKIHKYPIFIGVETINAINFSFDYVCDAVDNVTAKLLIIEKAKVNNIPIISSMGTGNKIDPLRFQIKDINQTKVCPLARVIRLELKKRNIKDVKVLYSEEEPIKNGSRIPSSISFTPSIAGILIAREVILKLVNKK